jgi:hypothetical protein
LAADALRSAVAVGGASAGAAWTTVAVGSRDEAESAGAVSGMELRFTRAAVAAAVAAFPAIAAAATAFFPTVVVAAVEVVGSCCGRGIGGGEPE